jgi:serine/threonine protein kinase/WD40 repeat protein
MADLACPSHAALTGFVLGTLPEPELERVAGHLDGCPGCEAAVNALEGITDPIVAAIRHPGSSSAALADPADDASRSLLPEQFGDFRLLREIGRGGMGLVYEAEQVSLGRRVALKVLPHRALLDPASLERFRREARAAAGLHHTNIVPVFGTGEQDGLHYFVMQLIPGVGLDKVLRELKQNQDRGPVASPAPVQAVVRELFTSRPAAAGGPGRAYWLAVARLGAQVADALEYAHAHGVIHRDVKPSNLLLDLQGTVWVTDFGLAKAVAEEQDLTRSGDIIGTVRYMAPERFDGEADGRGDVYSLGVTLYELLTLRDAFPDADRTVLLRRKLHAEPPQPRRVNPDVPCDLETIVLRAIAREPGHRYQTAGDLAADLHRFVEDRPVRARRVTAPERLWRWCRRDPRTASLVTALLVVLVAGLVGVATQWWRAEIKADDEKEARDRADAARTDADTHARAEAEARSRADAAREQARAHLYLSDIARAGLEWRLNNTARVERLLEQCEPERRGWEWYYLRGVNHPELMTLRSQTLNMVFGVAFSPDRRLMAFSGWDYYVNPSGGAPTTVVICDVRSGKQVRTLLARGVGLRPAFSPDGRLLAVSSADYGVQIWEVATGRLLETWEEKGMAAFSPDGRHLAVGGRKAVTIREVAGGGLVQRYPSSGGRAHYSPDGRLLAVSGASAVELLSAQNGEEMGRLPYGPGDEIDPFFQGLGPDLDFSPDGKLLVTATNPPRVWEVATRRQLTTLGGHQGIVPGVAFGPDGRRIATVGADTTVRIWETLTGRERMVLRGHTGPVACVAFHPDGWCLASAGREPGDVKLWDLTRDPEHLTVSGGLSQALTFDAGGRLKMLTNLGRVQTYDPTSGQTEAGPKIDLLRRFLAPAKVAVFSGDGKFVAAVSNDPPTVNVFEAATGEKQMALRGLELLPTQVVISQDGRRVASANSVGGTMVVRAVRVWDAVTGQALAQYQERMPEFRDYFGALALSPDGKRLAYDVYETAKNGSTQGRVQTCAADGGREQLSLAIGNVGVCCLAFSDDGRRLAAGRLDGQVLVWDTATGQRLGTNPLGFLPYSLTFSPDGRRLAVADREVVALWDVTLGESIFTLRGARPRPSDIATNPALAWSRDGRWLAATNWDGTVALWDGNTARPPADKAALERVPAARAYIWHLDHAEGALTAGQLSAAAFHLDRLGAEEPPDLVSRGRRGRLSLRRCDWQRAASDFKAVFAATEPDDAGLWLDHARVLLLQRDRAGYRRLVPRMIAHCRRDADASRPEAAEVRACTLGPEAPADPAEVVRRAEAAVKATKGGNVEALLSLGLALYRAGQAEKAVARLEEAGERAPDSAWVVWPALALAHTKLGNTREAGRWLQKAEDWHQKEDRRRRQESAGFAPAQWADFEILYHEALAAKDRAGH